MCLHQSFLPLEPPAHSTGPDDTMELNTHDERHDMTSVYVCVCVCMRVCVKHVSGNAHTNQSTVLTHPDTDRLKPIQPLCLVWVFPLPRKHAWD